MEDTEPSRPQGANKVANLLDFTVRRQRRVVRSTFAAELNGLVDSVEQLVLHHINSSNRRLDTWMEAEAARLTSEGQRLKIGPFVRSCIVRRLSMNIPLLEAGLWPEGVAFVPALRKMRPR